jgi:hypothetical protein
MSRREREGKLPALLPQPESLGQTFAKNQVLFVAAPFPTGANEFDVVFQGGA